MTNPTDYPNLPAYMEDMREWMRRSIPVLHGLQNGKLNVGGSVTLTTSTTTTTITFPDGKLSSSSRVTLTPTTANAAAEVGAGGMYISSIDVVNKKVVLTHANNSNNDRTFHYVLIG